MSVDALLEHGAFLLAQMGVPVDEVTKRRRDHASRAFLTLAGLRPGIPWTQAQDFGSRCLTTKEILAYGRKHLGESRSDGSYDDVRRADLKPMVLSGIVRPAANKPGASTNDATRGYGLAPEVARLVRAYQSKAWQAELETFRQSWGSLVEELARRRKLEMISVTIPGGTSLTFRPDAHNQLQKAVIEQFLPRYGYGAELLYVGDTANKSLFVNEALIRELKFFELSHDALPDVVAYSRSRNWLYLIEAVSASGPVDEQRRLVLERKLGHLSAPRIYVTAFQTRQMFRKWSAKVAWETEAWVADHPDHLVHFNGDKFLGPYPVS
jgi:type II restriction enzyme